jgi:hypothetical protein
VLGDVVSLTNEGLVEGYSFAGNLLSYLANRSAGPQSLWRQWATVLCSVGLVVLLARFLDTRRLVVVSLVLFVAWSICGRISLHAGRVVPDGRLISGSDSADLENRLAYIDASHLEPYSREDWGFDALNGLALNLMRNGFLPLTLHELTAERLDRAGLVISIAPARGFSGRERRLVQQFVEGGGLWVSMVGAEQARAGAPLLADLGLRVPHSPVATVEDQWEPEPFGRGRAEYLEVEDEQEEPYRVAVRLFAGWPVESLTDDAEVLAYGRNQLRIVTSDTELPVILTRAIGRGRVILIGDTSFAMNKNLEYVGGEPFAGRYENAQFWRWLLTRMTGRAEWVPPRPPPPDDSAENEDDDDFEWSEGDQ